MKSKVWVLALCLFTSCFLGLVVLWNVILDPFSQLRDDGLYLKNSDYQRYINAGIIKNNHEYNALVLGSSYIANFNTEIIDKTFGVKSQVISIYGGSRKEISCTLEYALAKRPELKMVILDTTIWNICNMECHPTLEFPEGFYKDRYLEILPYFFSFDLSLLSLRKTACFYLLFPKAEFPYSNSLKFLYPWYEKNKNCFGDRNKLEEEFNVMNSSKDCPTNIPKEKIEKDAQVVVNCFEENILKILQQYPNVTFYLINPPNFQWCLWVRYQIGVLQGWIRAEEIIAEKLASFPNIRFYDFYAASDILNDCTRFMDFGHFDLQTADYIIECIKEGKYMRTPATNSFLTKEIQTNLEKQRVSCPYNER